MRSERDRVSHGRRPSPSRLPRPSLLVTGDPVIPPPDRISGAAPIIVTATMGAADQRRFDALRTAHYPPDRNHVAAHITLFHQLPPSALAELERLFRAIAADTPPPAARLRAVYSLGRGVAFQIDSPDLLAVRARVAERFAGMLTRQDQAAPRLHITVQNKVEPTQARALLAELARDFVPRPLTIMGLAVHHYRGGPWEAAFSRNFRGQRRAY